MNELSNRMIRTINNLSRMNESLGGTNKFQCSRCKAISEGVKIDGAEEVVCPLCDTEMEIDDKYYETQLEINPVRESSDIEDDEDELKDVVEELEDIRENYITLVHESRLYKARKLVEEADVEIVVDPEGITPEGDVEEDAISVKKDVELSDGSEVTLVVNESDCEDKDEEDDSVNESLSRRVRRVKHPMFNRSRYLKESEELSGWELLDEDDDEEMTYSKNLNPVVLDEELSSEAQELVDTLEVAKEELKDEVETVVEAHRRKLRNIVVRESLGQVSDKNLSNEDKISAEGEELEENVVSVVESKFRKLNRSIKEAKDESGKDIIIQDKDDLVDEVEELITEYTNKRTERRRRLVESSTSSTLEDVIDTDEDLLEELEDNIDDAIEETVSGTIEDVKESDKDQEDFVESYSDRRGLDARIKNRRGRRPDARIKKYMKR